MSLINKYLETYGAGEDDRLVELRVNEILKIIPDHPNQEVLRKIFSLIDLTSLNTQDNQSTARSLCDKVNQMHQFFPEDPMVAAICVYPPLVESVKKNLQAPGVSLAAVGAGFPSSQTFLAVKLAECELLVKKGADELDVVIPVGKMIAGECEAVFDEIYMIKQTIGETHLKVILETGLLKSAEKIRLASLIALEAGADFIKTSTGKTSPAASPEAVYIMLKAIRDYHSITGRKAGIKPAGGIGTSAEALPYYYLVEQILGEDWLNPSLFRIGASRLANHLLSDIHQSTVSYF